MNNRLKIGIAAAGIIIAIIGCYLVLMETDNAPSLATQQPAEIPAANPSPAPSAVSATPAPPPTSGGNDSGQAIIEDRIVLELRKNYGQTISQVATQASLFGIRAYVLSLFPENGPDVFLRIIRRAFPDVADAILKTLAKMDAYNEWLAENDAALAQMSEYDRTAALWEKREALFGEAAREIWAGELLASDARKKSMQDTMAVLQESRDTTIEEKLDMFNTALRETYENTPEEFVLGYKDMSAKVFFSLDAVQEELKNMPPDQRQFEINKIRREMGFSQEEIEKMEEYDAVREKRWQVGLNYMAERDAVVAGSQGPEQAEKLKALREKYFQDEAGTIELEEKDNFFRFKRERVYGRN